MDAGISLLWAAMRSRYEERGVGSRGENQNGLSAVHTFKAPVFRKLGPLNEPKKNTHERVRSV